MQLTLDLSPMLVNRTAVYDICLEVAGIVRARQAAGTDCEIDYQFIGERCPQMPPAGAQRDLRDRFFRQLGDPPRVLAARRDRQAAADQQAGGKRAGGRHRTFYLDPVYTLFGDLGADDIVMCHDLSPVTHPHWHGANVDVLYNGAFSAMARSGCTVLADSDNTADTLRANYGARPGALRTLHLYLPKLVAQARAATTAAAAQRQAGSAPYFLFVGSLEARKNITGAIEAFRLSGLGASGYRLLVIGGRAHGAEAIERRAAEVEGVVLCGYLSEAEKLAAYAGATGFVYPSYLEGFGIPLLEAMAFGLPCVTTVTGASPEVGGPDVPCLDPDDHPGLAAALRSIAGLSERARTRLGNRLRKRAEEEFSFDRFARNIEDMLFA